MAVNPVLSDILRYGKGLGQAGRAIAQPMLGDIPAGMAGLGSMMVGENMDQAAARVNAVRDQFAYSPDTEEGQMYLGKLGQGVEKVVETARKVPGVKQAEAGWEGFTQKAPAIAAVTAGVVGAGVPEGRGAKVATTTVDAVRDAEKARIAALRAVRESTPAGPVFRSALEEAIPSLQPKATLGQYVATLRNKPGIKGEELDDLGLSTMDPNTPATREQLAQWVQELRPERSQLRRAGEEIPPEAIDEKVDELFRPHLEGLAARRKVFEESGLTMPEGLVHPEDARDLEMRRRRQEWDETAYEEHIDKALRHAERSRPDLAKAAAEGDDDALELLHDAASTLLDEARTSRRRYGELMGYRDPDDTVWEAHQAQFGNPRENPREATNQFIEALRGNTDFLKAWQQKTRGDVMDNPQSYRWNDDVPAPKYPYMNYYNDVDQGKAAGYSELTEQQGPLKTSMDPRGYKEPHWPPTADAEHSPNNVTLHARFSAVRNAEGDPATLVNELQSKYASDVGSAGTTATPHQVLDVWEYAALEGKNLRKALDESFSSGDDSKLNDMMDNMDQRDVEIIREAYRGMHTNPDRAAAQAALDEAIADVEINIADSAKRSQQGEYMLYNPASQMPVSAANYGGKGNWGRGFATKEAAQAAVEGIQRGDSTPAFFDPQRDTELAKHLADNPRTPFQGDTRLPPRAGLKSWRLRGLKMALREAADRGHNDLYLPTGDMMPRIEGWADEEMFDPELVNLPEDPRDYGYSRTRGRNVSREMLDANAAEGAQEMTESADAIMKNYEERLPKELDKYLKQFGAKVEDDMLYPATKGQKKQGRSAKRVKFTPELLAEILRGQKLYQLGGGAALLGALAAGQEEQPSL